MAQPVYFTIEGDYKSVVADTILDANVDPDLGPVTATVTFTPLVNVGDVLLAIMATPRPTGFVAAPIVGRIDVDGQVKLRVDVTTDYVPSGDRLNFATLAAFPPVGDTTKIYEAEDTDIKYRWTGQRYVDFDPVRLLADTELLNLAGPLFYRVEFTNVRFNGQPGILNSFVVQAKSTDTTLNLIVEGRAPGTPAVGVTRGEDGAPVDDVAVNGDGDLVFYVDGVPIGDPIPLPSGGGGVQRYTHVQSSPAATWTIANPLGASTYPAAVNVIVGGQEVDADVDLTDLQFIVITFATPQSGRAVIA